MLGIKHRGLVRGGVRSLAARGDAAGQGQHRQDAIHALHDQTSHDPSTDMFDNAAGYRGLNSGSTAVPSVVALLPTSNAIACSTVGRIPASRRHSAKIGDAMTSLYTGARSCEDNRARAIGSSRLTRSRRPRVRCKAPPTPRFPAPRVSRRPRRRRRRDGAA